MDIIEGKLKFIFPETVKVKKYDELVFYRTAFNGCFGGTKAVDILCTENNQAWLIEVKDYRQYQRTKTIDLSEEIALKVRDTLAGLVCMKANASDADEQQFASLFLKQQRLRIVLHLEQPKHQSRLFPQAIDVSKLKQKMKPLLKAVDPHFIIMDKETAPSAICWNILSN